MSMAGKNCPWCGKPLEKKRVLHGDKIREVCARCGYKLKEYKRPEEPKKEPENTAALEVREEERPIVQQKPVWPWIIGGLIILLLIIFIIKQFLV